MENPNADTFDRSCAHWSEAGRNEMEHFYVLATEDYRQLAIAQDWVRWLEQRRHGAGDRPLRLLDVACGSGKFPVALLQHGGVDDHRVEAIDYDLLDPSDFSLAEARRVLRPPFQAQRNYHCRLQDLEIDPPGWDVVWATHALYALPAEELTDGLRRFAAAIAPGGAGFIAHACADAHYLAFYRAYLDTPRGHAQTPYSSAEELAATFNQLGVSFTSRDLHYVAAAPGDATDIVEGYLQRCLFDDGLKLGEMLSDPVLGPYLEHCREGGDWQFRQHVRMFFLER